jgi:hypothetical protein
MNHGMPTTPGSYRDRSARSWRGTLAALASRGEVDGPRVVEAKGGILLAHMGIEASHSRTMAINIA